MTFDGRAERLCGTHVRLVSFAHFSRIDFYSHYVVVVQ